MMMLFESSSVCASVGASMSCTLGGHGGGGGSGATSAPEHGPPATTTYATAGSPASSAPPMIGCAPCPVGALLMVPNPLLAPQLPAA